MQVEQILKLVEELTEELQVSSEQGPSSQSEELEALKIEPTQKDFLCSVQIYHPHLPLPILVGHLLMTLMPPFAFGTYLVLVLLFSRQVRLGLVLEDLVSSSSLANSLQVFKQVLMV